MLPPAASMHQARVHTGDINGIGVKVQNNIFSAPSHLDRLFF